MIWSSTDFSLSMYVCSQNMVDVRVTAIISTGVSMFFLSYSKFQKEIKWISSQARKQFKSSHNIIVEYEKLLTICMDSTWSYGRNSSCYTQNNGFDKATAQNESIRITEHEAVDKSEKRSLCKFNLFALFCCNCWKFAQNVCACVVACSLCLCLHSISN